MVVSPYVLGWWNGTEWVTGARRDEELPASLGPVDFHVAFLGVEDEIGSGTGEIADNCPTYPVLAVDIGDTGPMTRYLPEDPALAGSISGVAISAPWDLTPRPIRETAPREELEDVAIGLLTERGFETDQANLFQVVDADLDGDGSTETVVVAEDTELIFDASSGVYSMVYAVSPAWEEPLVIVDEIIPVGEEGSAEVNRIGAIADLSGDGKMEVVINGGAYESSWHTVYELTDTGFVDRIGAGCGV